MHKAKIEYLTRLRHEKNILIIIGLTVFAMIGEIAFGYITKSMSLLAEGYHMGLHVLTLGLTYIAYVIARKLKDSPLFENGTNKIGVLAGYTSALLLLIAGAHIFFESAARFFHPEQIKFTEAIYASVFALIINFICITIMEGKFHRHHRKKDNKDYNYLAAYLHILSDILISLLTIAALIFGKIFNCIHLDALTGILGAVLIIIWALKLIKNTVKILIDMKENDK